MIDVRPATEGDLSALNELYNAYIAESAATFDIAAFTMERRREWFTHYATSGRYRLFVATEVTRLIGYTCSSPFRPKEAYEPSVETTVYCTRGSEGRGIGSALYHALFEALDSEDVHRAYAGITMPNPASVALHERFGFKQVAYFSEQGRKFGRFWDVAWYEKAMGEGLT